MTEPRTAEARRRARATFRQRYRRIDYSPGNDALKAIERLQAERPGESLRLLLDRLIVMGDRYFRESGGGQS